MFRQTIPRKESPTRVPPPTVKPNSLYRPYKPPSGKTSAPSLPLSSNIYIKYNSPLSLDFIGSIPYPYRIPLSRSYRILPPQCSPASPAPSNSPPVAPPPPPPSRTLTTTLTPPPPPPTPARPSKPSPPKYSKYPNFLRLQSQQFTV